MPKFNRKKLSVLDKRTFAFYNKKIRIFNIFTEVAMKGKMLVFEGLDFSGKSTLSKMMAKRINGVYYKTPPENYVEIIKKMDESSPFIFTEERLLLFLESLKSASSEIEKILESEKNVIVDRWVWTTLSYHFANNQQLYRKWQNNWKKLTSGLIIADVEFFVTIDNSILKERVALRGEMSPNDKLLLSRMDIRETIKGLFLSLNPNFIILNNSGAIEETLNKASFLIKK